MKWWMYVLILLCTFCAGRFSAPERIKIETKIVEVERKSEDTKKDVDKNKHKETKVVEVVKPDGSKETTTTTTEDSASNSSKETSTNTETETASTTSKEVTRSSSKTILSAMYGIPFTGGLPVYGGSVYREVIGPIGIGASYLTSGVVCVSLGLSL